MKKRGIKRMIHWINRFIAKKQAISNAKKRNEIIHNLDKNEEKLFELFKVVLKHHTYLCKFDSDREISDNLTSILITETTARNETCIIIKKKDGTVMEFFVNSQKAGLFKDEFDKATKRLSIRHSLDKKRGVEKQLDDLIEKENKKDKKNS